MSDTSAARAAILAAWRDATVATAAVVALSTWNNADQSIGHVVSLPEPGVINRGRLPMVELIFTNQFRSRTTDEGGMSDMTFIARVIVGGVSGLVNQEKAEAILQAGVDAVRNGLNASGKYWSVANDSVPQHESGPMFHKLESAITCENTFEREH